MLCCYSNHNEKYFSEVRARERLAHCSTAKVVGSMELLSPREIRNQTKGKNQTEYCIYDVFVYDDTPSSAYLYST